jgi:photosystem II stability/assembly factor-like uncharacterized protein
MAREAHLLVADEHGLLHLSSPEGGSAWSAPKTVLDVEAVAVKGAPDGTVYVGTRGNGLFRSKNGLDAWEQVETPTGLEKIRSIYITPDRFLVGTEAGERPAGVYEWDGRRNWQQLGDVMTCPGSSQWFYPVPTEGVHIRDLSLDPNQPERIYAAVQVGGVAISPDNGDTWYDKRNLDLDVHMVQPHPDRPGVVYAGSGGDGVFRSSDGGETWQRIAQECGNFVVEFAMDPRDPSRMYLGTGRGHVPDWRKDPAGARGEMFRSEDGGDSWRKLRNGLPDQMQARPNTVFVDPEEPDNVYFGAGLVRNTGATDGGVFHSPDCGETWRKVVGGGEPVALWTRWE